MVDELLPTKVLKDFITESQFVVRVVGSEWKRKGLPKRWKFHQTPIQSLVECLTTFFILMLNVTKTRVSGVTDLKNFERHQLLERVTFSDGSTYSQKFTF